MNNKEIGLIGLLYPESHLRKSNTTLVGHLQLQHRLRRSMPIVEGSQFYVLHLPQSQFCLVILHVIDEHANGVVGAEIFSSTNCLGRCCRRREGGERNGEDVFGGEAEDVF